MFALVAMVGIPAFALADATPKGTTTVMYEIPTKTSNPILDQLNALEAEKKGASESEIEELQAAQDRLIIQDRKNKPVYSEESTRELDILAEKLADHIIEKRGNFKDGQENYIPFTEIGYYPNDNAVKVGIHQDFVNEENFEKYSSIARSILGDKVNVIIYNDGDYGSLDACATTESDCSPMEAGIRINIDGQGGCTLGFPATRTVSSVDYDGFVTAGHCGDGSTGEDVDQQNTRKVGELMKETFDDGSSAEYCDCAFVELTESVTLDYEIFDISSSYYPDHTGTAGTNDYIKMIGYNSGIEIGQVEATSVTVTIDGTTFKHMVKADYDRMSGDSGGVVMEAYSGDPAYLGSHTGVKDGYTYYVKYYKFESHIGDITWGF